MRKRLRHKRAACSLCKPHKTGHANRWKAKDEAFLQSSDREMRMHLQTAPRADG